MLKMRRELRVMSRSKAILVREAWSQQRLEWLCFEQHLGDGVKSTSAGLGRGGPEIESPV